MKEFKRLFFLGIAAIIIIGAMIIQYAVPARTVDFSGTVHCVTHCENGVIILHAEAVSGGDFMFRIDEDSELTDIDGVSIGCERLKEGTTVLINYRKYFLKDEDIHTVKTLKLI